MIASPKECRKLEEIAKDENLDFTQYCFDGKHEITIGKDSISYHFILGKVVLKKNKREPFYTKLASYYRYLQKQERIRNHPEVKKNLIAEYGEIRSFLADKYPECVQYRPPKKEVEEEETAV